MKIKDDSRVLALAAAIAMASLCVGCGDSGGDGSAGTGGEDNGLTDAERACELTDSETVTDIFEGTASEGVPGSARNCRFELTGGEAESVSVFYFGAESSWDGVREGFEDNRGGTTGVSDIGDEAFYPNDVGPSSLVVRANGIIFEVSPLLPTTFPPTEPSEELEADVAELARTIADG